MKNDNIILIGMPGCGKSTIGVLLAKMLGYRFIDTDLLIQEKAGKRLFEIINEDGAEYFSRLEDEVNASLTAEKTVIATGGSVIYGVNAMKNLKSLGKVVYLKVEEEEIEKRIDNLSTRGIVFNSDDGIAGLYRERTPLYEKYADITVECTGDRLQRNAEKIIDSL